MATQTIKERLVEKGSSVRRLLALMLGFTLCVIVLYYPRDPGIQGLFRDVVLLVLGNLFGFASRTPGEVVSATGAGGK
jgi:hypothetical protein